MQTDFNKIMSHQSDAELIEVLTRKQEEYQPEALLAAKAEIDKRELSVESMESAKQEVELKHITKKENANTPLGTGWKICTFLLPGILNILIASAIKAEGYERKWKDAWRWTFYGVGFYIGLIILCYFLVVL